MTQYNTSPKNSVGPGYTLLLDDPSFAVEGFPLLVKIEMGPEYLFEKCGFALEQEDDGCRPVQNHTGEQYRPKGKWR